MTESQSSKDPSEGEGADHNSEPDLMEFILSGSERPDDPVRPGEAEPVEDDAQPMAEDDATRA